MARKKEREITAQSRDGMRHFCHRTEWDVVFRADRLPMLDEVDEDTRVNALSELTQSLQRRGPRDVYSVLADD